MDISADTGTIQDNDTTGIYTYWGQKVDIQYGIDKEKYDSNDPYNFIPGSIHILTSQPSRMTWHTSQVVELANKLGPIMANYQDDTSANDTVVVYTGHGGMYFTSPNNNEKGIDPDNAEIEIYFDVPLNYKSLAGYNLCNANDTAPPDTSWEYHDTNVQIRYANVKDALGTDKPGDWYSLNNNPLSIKYKYTLLTDCTMSDTNSLSDTASADTTQVVRFSRRPPSDKIRITLSNLQSNTEYDIRLNPTILDSLNTYLDDTYIILRFKTLTKKGEPLIAESTYEDFGHTYMVFKEGATDTAGYGHIAFRKSDLKKYYGVKYEDVPEPRELNVFDDKKIGGIDPEIDVVLPGGKFIPTNQIDIIKGSIRDFRFDIKQGTGWIDYFDRDGDAVADGWENHSETGDYKFNGVIDYEAKVMPYPPEGFPAVLEIPYAVAEDYPNDGSDAIVYGFDESGKLKPTAFRESELKLFRLTKDDKGKYFWEYVKGSGPLFTVDADGNRKYPARGEKRIHAVVNHLSVYSIIGVKPPDKTAIWWNYPNPFYPNSPDEKKNRTYIAFELERAGDVTIKIYTISGEEVITLIEDQPYQPVRIMFENNIPTWDGKNWAGNKVASGVYIIRFDVKYDDGDKYTGYRKVAVVK